MQQNAGDAMMSSYKNLLILETESTHNMNCSKGGRNLNASTGSKRIKEQSKFPGISEAAMHSTSFLTNILSFGRLQKLDWEIEYKCDEDKFLVSDPDQSFTVEFHSNEDCLYAAKPGPKYLKYIETKKKTNLKKESSFL